MTEERLEELAKDVALIKERNSRVEADKAWEVSAFRITSICFITYIVASVLLYVIGAERFWLGALVPATGYVLSAQSLPVIKRWWIQTRYKHH